MSFLFSGHNCFHSYNIHRASHYRGKESGGDSRLLLHPKDKLVLQAAGSLTQTRPACACSRAGPRKPALCCSPSVCACSQRAGWGDEAVPAGTWLPLTLLQHPPPRAEISSSAMCLLRWKLVANQCHPGVVRATGDGSFNGEAR